MVREREGGNHTSSRVEPADVLTVFEARSDLGRPLTAPDVAAALDIARRTAHNKLRVLVARGDLETRKVGARGRVWWQPVPRKAVDSASRDPIDEGDPKPQDETAVSTPRSDPQTATNSATTPSTERKSNLAAVEFPESRDRDRCEAAVLAAYEYLREHGSATMRGLVTNVMPTQPVGYEVPELDPGERYRGGWWRLVVKPGLKALPEVEAPEPGASEWRIHDDSDADD